MRPLSLDHSDLMHCSRGSEEEGECRPEGMVRLQVGDDLESDLETHPCFDELRGVGVIRE